MENFSLFSSASYGLSSAPQSLSLQLSITVQLASATLDSRPSRQLLEVVQAIRNLHTWFSPQDFSRLSRVNRCFALQTHSVWKQLYLQTKKTYEKMNPDHHHILPNYAPENYQSVYLQLSKLHYPLHTRGLMADFAFKGCSAMINLIAAHHPEKIEERERDGHTPLSKAVSSGHLHVVNTLLKHRASLTGVTYSPFFTSPTILMVAAGRDSWDSINAINIMKALLNAGADVHAVDNRGRTALAYAASNCSTRTRLLLTFPTSPAHVDAYDHAGITPLMLAASAGNVNSVKTLIEFNANIEARDNTGKTALAYAAFEKKTAAIATLLLHNANIDITVNTHTHLLSYAVSPHSDYLGDSSLDEIGKAIKMFLETHRMPPLKMEDSHFLKVIDFASVYWKRILVELYANTPDAQGNTMLMRTINTPGNTEILVRAGAELNAQNHEGETALIQATKLRSRHSVRLLLDHQADVRLRDKNSKTALAYAKPKTDDKDYFNAITIQNMLTR